MKSKYYKIGKLSMRVSFFILYFYLIALTVTLNRTKIIHGFLCIFEAIVNIRAIVLNLGFFSTSREET